MKIPFDIKYRPQIESGEYKLITRSGLPVRIICWEAKNNLGRDVKEIIYCGWASPKESQLAKHKDETRRQGVGVYCGNAMIEEIQNI